jgi:hypothetical protein
VTEPLSSKQVSLSEEALERLYRIETAAREVDYAVEQTADHTKWFKALSDMHYTLELPTEPVDERDEQNVLPVNKDSGQFTWSNPIQGLWDGVTSRTAAAPSPMSMASALHYAKNAKAQDRAEWTDSEEAVIVLADEIERLRTALVRIDELMIRERQSNKSYVREVRKTAQDAIHGLPDETSAVQGGIKQMLDLKKLADKL